MKRVINTISRQILSDLKWIEGSSHEITDSERTFAKVLMAPGSRNSKQFVKHVPLDPFSRQEFAKMYESEGSSLRTKNEAGFIPHGSNSAFQVVRNRLLEIGTINEIVQQFGVHNILANKAVFDLAFNKATYQAAEQCHTTARDLSQSSMSLVLKKVLVSDDDFKIANISWRSLLRGLGKYNIIKTRASQDMGDCIVDELNLLYALKLRSTGKPFVGCKDIWKIVSETNETKSEDEDAFYVKMRDGVIENFAKKNESPAQLRKLVRNIQKDFYLLHVKFDTHEEFIEKLKVLNEHVGKTKDFELFFTCVNYNNVPNFSNEFLETVKHVKQPVNLVAKLINSVKVKKSIIEQLLQFCGQNELSSVRNSRSLECLYIY